MTSEPIKNQINRQKTSTQETSPLAKVGAYLKKERESQKLSSLDLAESLRIGEEQLIALENGEEELLPEFVFIKAMVRRVAERLHLDPDELIKNLTIDLAAPKEYIDPNLERKSLLSSLKSLQLSPLLYLSILSIVLGLSLLKLYYKNISTKNFNENAQILASEGLNKNEKAVPALKIIISSRRPTKMTIITASGKILFTGTMRKPLTYLLEEDVEIFATRPDLIKLKKGDNPSFKLGLKDEIKWYKIKRGPS